VLEALPEAKKESEAANPAASGLKRRSGFAELDQRFADIGPGEQAVEGIDARLDALKNGLPVLEAPSASQRRSEAKASSKRPHSSSALKPCMSAVLDSRFT